MRRPSRPRHRARLLPAGVVIIALTACGRPPAPTPAPAPPEALRITRVPDANIAALLVMSHNVDLAAAGIAATRARDQGVKLLARRMTTDHTSMSTTLRKLLAQIRLTPREDDVSRLMRDQNVALRDTLRSLSGRRFDSAYVANEVRYHRELLVAVDRVFLPSVRRPELKDYVTAMRPTIEEHLVYAQRVQATIAAMK